MAWLDTNPPKRSQFRRPRRRKPSGVVVVHTAENAPDTVATDGGAEAVANFIRDRADPGSYHDLCDSDSCINLVAYDCEAYQDGTGTNSHAYAVSIATTAAWWPLAPAAWRDGAIEQAALATARYAAWIKGEHGIVIPARRITRAESTDGVPGFVTHAQRDPGRRSDPGAGFPYDQFLARFAELTDQQEDDDMFGPGDPLYDNLTTLFDEGSFKADGRPAVFITTDPSVDDRWFLYDGFTRRPVAPDENQLLLDLGLVTYHPDGSLVKVINPPDMAAIPFHPEWTDSL